jgi:beta-1,4-mannosyltransferase
MKKTVIALSPMTLPDNDFIENFTSALTDPKRRIVPIRWRFVDLARADVVVLHWPNSMFNPELAKFGRRNLLKIRIARKLFGTKFIWVVHNLIPHDAVASSGLSKRFLRSLSGLIHLSKASHELVNAEYGLDYPAIHLTTVHGQYLSVSPATKPRDLPEESDVSIGYVGQVKPYKGLEMLIRAAEGLESVQANIAIVGKSNDSSYTKGILSASQNAGVRTDIRESLISTVDLEKIVDEFDAIALPYSRVLNSGSALFCLSRHRPIIVPRTGSLPELAEDVGAGWVYLYDGDLTSKVLGDAVAWLRATSPERRKGPDLTSYSWSRVRDDLNRLLGSIRAV